MQKRVRIALVVAVVVIAVLGELALHRSEPSYEGRALSDWCVALMSRGLDEDKARAVIRQYGTNSIPLLLEWLRRDDRPTLGGRVRDLKNKGTEWLVNHRIIHSRPIPINLDYKRSYRALAAAALTELGPRAKAAIPPLIQMLSERKHNPDDTSERAGLASYLLGGMAPESIQPLIDALASHDAQVYALARGALGRIGPAAKAALPVLEEHLTDKEPAFRLGAAATIGELGGNPDGFIPVLVQGFREGDVDTRSYVLWVLMHHKEHAASFVPALVEGLNDAVGRSDTNGTLRQEIVAALKEIDPEAAAQAGVN